MIQAKVVADSLNEFGNRLTSLLVTMPRYILAEFNTHRMLSKNSASSRAIPFKKMVSAVEENPFIPVAWMKDHSGMQGKEYITDEDEIKFLIQEWTTAAFGNTFIAEILNKSGVTKQMCNRLLEPFMWHTVLVTATEWENFFALRCPDYMTGIDREKSFRSWKDLSNFEYEYLTRDGSLVDFDNSADIIKRLKLNRGQADIHMMLTAEAIWDAMNESTPKLLKAGEWHIPFGDDIRLNYKNTNGASYTEEEWSIEFVKIATARCAQTSYTVIGEDEKELNYEKLIALHDRLSKSGHWSPFEHCAKCMSYEEYHILPLRTTAMFTEKEIQELKDLSGWSGNFRGFIQYRKSFANENITK